MSSPCPSTNVVKGVSSSAFYGPGSIVKVTHAKPDRLSIGMLTVGMPEEGSVYFDRSLAFEAKGSTKLEPVTAYASSHVLESGWMLGAEKIQGRSAEVVMAVDKGRVLLFAFPPQHRGQTHGTFRLLFNGLLFGKDLPWR